MQLRSVLAWHLPQQFGCREEIITLADHDRRDIAKLTSPTRHLKSRYEARFAQGRRDLRFYTGLRKWHGSC